MTNRLSIIIGLLIFAIFALDFVVLDGELPIILARKLEVLTDYIAIWR